MELNDYVPIGIHPFIIDKREVFAELYNTATFALYLHTSGEKLYLKWDLPKLTLSIDVPGQQPPNVSEPHTSFPLTGGYPPKIGRQYIAFDDLTARPVFTGPRYNARITGTVQVPQCPTDEEVTVQWYPIITSQLVYADPEKGICEVIASYTSKDPRVKNNGGAVLELTPLGKRVIAQYLPYMATLDVDAVLQDVVDNIPGLTNPAIPRSNLYWFVKCSFYSPELLDEYCRIEKIYFNTEDMVTKYENMQDFSAALSATAIIVSFTNLPYALAIGTALSIIALTVGCYASFMEEKHEEKLKELSELLGKIQKIILITPCLITGTVSVYPRGNISLRGPKTGKDGIDYIKPVDVGNYYITTRSLNFLQFQFYGRIPKSRILYAIPYFNSYGSFGIPVEITPEISIRDKNMIYCEVKRTVNNWVQIDRELVPALADSIDLSAAFDLEIHMGIDYELTRTPGTPDDTDAYGHSTEIFRFGLETSGADARSNDLDIPSRSYDLEFYSVRVEFVPVSPLPPFDILLPPHHIIDIPTIPALQGINPGDFKLVKDQEYYNKKKIAVYTSRKGEETSKIDMKKAGHTIHLSIRSKGIEKNRYNIIPMIQCTPAVLSPPKPFREKLNNQLISKLERKLIPANQISVVDPKTKTELDVWVCINHQDVPGEALFLLHLGKLPVNSWTITYFQKEIFLEFNDKEKYSIKITT
jgi:hypothetical protein